VRPLQNLVSARPSSSAASPQATSALRMQRRRTKPLRGRPTAGSPIGIEWPSLMPREPPRGVFGVTQRSSWRLGDLAMTPRPPTLRVSALTQQSCHEPQSNRTSILKDTYRPFSRGQRFRFSIRRYEISREQRSFPVSNGPFGPLFLRLSALLRNRKPLLCGW